MSANPHDFLDTNVLVYAFTRDPRAARAQALLQRGCVIGVQGLNEFANVAKRKLHMSWAEIGEAVRAICTVCGAVVPMDVETNGDAIRIAESDTDAHSLMLWSSHRPCALIAASCGLKTCTTASSSINSFALPIRFV